jgi:hypothetical protein
MTVKELIELLQKQDPTRKVVLPLQSGNSFTPCGTVFVGAYTSMNDWMGQMWIEPDGLTDDLKEEGYTEEDVVPFRDWERAVAIAPTDE